MLVIIESSDLIRARLFGLLRLGPLSCCAYAAPEQLLRNLARMESPVTLLICAERTASLPGIEFLRRLRSGRYPGLRADTLFLLMCEPSSGHQDEARSLEAVTVEHPKVRLGIGQLLHFYSSVSSANKIH